MDEILNLIESVSEVFYLPTLESYHPCQISQSSARNISFEQGLSDEGCIK